MGTDISKLSVRITSDGSGLTSGLKGTEGALNHLKGAAGDAGGVLQSSLSSMIGPAAAVAAAIGLAAKAYEAFTEHENAVAQLDARLRATGESAGYTSAQLQKMAGDLQELTVHSRAEVLAGEAVLLSFRNVKGDTFKAALKASTDLAAFLKTDLPSAAKVLGKALEEPGEGLNALRKAGVVFTYGQKEAIKAMEESGDVAGAQHLILAGLSSITGSAAAETQTLDGKMKQARNSASDLGDEILKTVAPALKDMANGLKDVNRLLSKNSDATQAIGTYINGSFGPLGILGSIFHSNGDAAKKAAEDYDSQSASLKAAASATGELNEAQEKQQRSIQETIAKLREQRDTFGLTAHQVEVYKVAMGGGSVQQIAFANGLAQTIDALTEWHKLCQEITKAEAEWNKETDDSISRLQEQIDTFGLSSAQAEVYKLEARGIKDEVLDMAKAMAEQVDALEANKKAYDEMAASAKKFIEESQSPLDKYLASLSEIKKAEAAGLLTHKQSISATDKANEDLVKALSGSGRASQTLNAIERRFTAGFQNPNQTYEEKMLRNAEQLAKHADAIRAAVQRIINEAAPVVSVGGI